MIFFFCDFDYYKAHAKHVLFYLEKQMTKKINSMVWYFAEEVELPEREFTYKAFFGHGRKNIFQEDTNTQTKKICCVV